MIQAEIQSRKGHSDSCVLLTISKNGRQLKCCLYNGELYKDNWCQEYVEAPRSLLRGVRLLKKLLGNIERDIVVKEAIR
jgi:hypothetical protein